MYNPSHFNITDSASLQELQEALGLPDPLMRIECYDISHVQGTNVVASMVVFEDGLPRKGEYRRFAVRTEGADDTTAMHEVLTRRFRRYLDGAAALAAMDLDTASWRELTAVPDRAARLLELITDLRVGYLPAAAGA